MGEGAAKTTGVGEEFPAMSLATPQGQRKVFLKIDLSETGI